MSASQSTPSAQPTPLGFSRFDQLPLFSKTKKALQNLNFSQLTPIQAQILPYTLVGYDAIGKAQTGTGKTVAFLLTAIEALQKKPFADNEARYLGEARALVLAPTRELAQQIFADCQALTKGMGFYNLCLTGGADMEKQQKDLERRFVDIVVGTPGRVIDWVGRSALFLDRVEVFALDEADRMLDMGFVPDIKRIVRHLPQTTHRQSLLFSATFNSDVMHLAYRWLRDPIFVEVSAEQKTNDDIEQIFYTVGNAQKFDALCCLLRRHATKTIVFANRKDQVDRLTKRLQAHFAAVEMSGDVAQNKRERHLRDFKSGKASVLVATDVAGRGIHVDDVGLVVNYTLPDSPDDYVHRIGRTGRAGHTGVAVSLVGEDDGFAIPDLERHLNAVFKPRLFDFDDDR